MRLRSALMGSVSPVWNAEGVGSGGAAADAGTDGAQAAADAGKSPESVLFPDDGAKPDGDADKAAGDKAGEDGDKPADDAAGKKPDDVADKVPEDGKYNLTMPEGVDVDQGLLDALGPQFKEFGLTNAQAQKLADKFIEAQTARMGKQSETWANTISKWADDAKADPEIGGAKWDGTVSAAVRAVNTLGSPALKEYLNATGGGNHPEVIRFMAKVGAMIKEDSPAIGGAEGAGKPADAAHILFPNDAPKG